MGNLCSNNRGCLTLTYILILFLSILLYLFIKRIEKKNFQVNDCFRSYPNENLLLPVRAYCKYTPFRYNYYWNESLKCINLSCVLHLHKKKRRVLFLSVIDDESFKYLLNLYKVFLLPHNIRSLVTIVFFKRTLHKCRRYKIYCVYQEWPYFLKNNIEVDKKKKLWFMKYYILYVIIKKDVSLLFIDSDVIFINNCLFDIVNRNEDIVLLRSQLSRRVTYGNSGITNIKSNNNTKQMMKYGLHYIIDYISQGRTDYLGDQEVISLSLKKFSNVSRGLYDFPLFTVGIPPENDIKTLCAVHPIHCDKEFSLKERLLYYGNENRYYTSLKNRYIIFSRNLLDKHLEKISNICKRYKLNIILPDQKCSMPDCVYEMKNSFGDLKLIKYFIKNNINLRESISFVLLLLVFLTYYSFLRHPLVPLKVKNEKINITITEINDTIIKSFRTIIVN